MNLADLEELTKWMRRVGAHRVRVGDLEVHLGAVPQPLGEAPRTLTDDEAIAALQRRRKRADALLYASSEGLPDEDEET